MPIVYLEPTAVAPSLAKTPLSAGAMQARHVPEGGLKYWLALAAASVLGCNAGDLFSSAFGFLAGLPLLGAGFAAILLAERNDRRPTQLYYWTAIILVRTAATNLADFFGQTIGGLSAVAALTAALAATLFLGRDRKPTAWSALPSIDLLYWSRMLLAGTLGTALGDATSFAAGFGLGGASLALSAIVALLIAGRGVGLFASTLSYWITIVAIRAAGTSLGDFSADRLGLATSFGVAAVVLGAIVFFRTRRPLVAATA